MDSGGGRHSSLTPAPDGGDGDRLSAAVDVDDVARAVLSEALDLPGVLRAGVALVQGAGRELAFTASDLRPDSRGRLDWSTIDGLSDLPIPDTVRTGHPVELVDLTGRHARYVGLVARQLELGALALATYPLTGPNDVLGGLELSFDTPRPYGADLRAAVRRLTDRAARALARVREHERHQVGVLHQRRGPAYLPAAGRLALAQHHVPVSPAEAPDTDWVEAVALGDGGWVLAAGRWAAPAGLGVEAARACVREAVALDARDPLDVLRHLDEARRAAGGDTTCGTSCVATVVAVDADGRHVRTASAGGAGPLVVRPGEVTAPQVTGAPLGSDDRARVPAAVDLRPADVLLLLSDPAAQDAAAQACRGGPDVEVLEALELCLYVRQALASAPAPGALSMLAAQPAPAGGVHRARLDLLDDAAAPARARHWLAEQLTEHGGADLVEAARLCVSELVTNALIHSVTGARLGLHLDRQRLLVHVLDGGGAAGHEEGRHAAEAVGGRGLVVVDAVAQAWGLQPGGEGTTAWFELRRDA